MGRFLWRMGIKEKSGMPVDGTTSWHDFFGETEAIARVHRYFCRSGQMDMETGHRRGRPISEYSSSGKIRAEVSSEDRRVDNSMYLWKLV